MSRITQTPENSLPGGGSRSAAPLPAVGSAGAPAGEGLEHLFKMSTTAGLGSEDYVAVNVTAVVAVMFGLASLLAAAGYILFVIPITGIILSFIALRQIRRSNGTQTGRLIAWLGLLLAGGISIGVLTYRGVQYAHRRADERALAQLCGDFGEYMVQNRPQEAYALFDDVFQKRVPFDLFKIHLTTLESGKRLPAIEFVSWNGLADFQNKDDGSEAADGMIWLKYKGADDVGRAPVFFYKPADKWLIRDIPILFPTIAPPEERDN